MFGLVVLAEVICWMTNKWMSWRLKGADTFYVPPVQYSLGMRSNNKATQVRSAMAWSRVYPPW